MRTSQTSILKWTKILSKFISVQLVVQSLGFASGILLVRTLSKEEYAYFTIANSMQGMMNVLADSGISSALSAIGGKVWQDPYRFGQLINTAMQWRRYLAIVAIIVTTPILIWMLMQNGAPVGYTLVLVVGILIELDFYLRIGVLGTVLRLHSQIDRIQKLDLLGAVSRLALLVGCFHFLNAGVGIFASTVASSFQAFILQKWTGKNINTHALTNKETQNEILKFVKHQMPGTIFFCIQGQLTVWLITIFGDVQSVAEIGALSRLSIIFSIIGSILTNIILPGFSRCQSKNILLDYYLKTLISCFIFSLILLMISYFYPNQLLLMLGKNYEALSHELLLMILNTNIGFINGVLWSINVSKGWVKQSWLYIPGTIAVQLILISTLNISTVQNAIIFNIISLIPGLLLNFYMSFQGFVDFKIE